MPLIRELVSFFVQTGYARIPEVLPDSAIVALRSVTEALFAQRQCPFRVNARGQISRVEGLIDRDPLFLEVLKSSIILDPLCALLGPNIEVLRYRHNHATLNRSGDIPFRLHRDIQQWSRPILSVFIYLDAATVENGCTHVVPGSQTLPYAGPQSADGGGNWADEHAAYRWLVGQEVPIPMPRGGVLLLNSLAFHSVGVNYTAGTRASMVFACHSTDELRETTDGSSELLTGRRYFKGNPALQVSGSLETAMARVSSNANNECQELDPGVSRSEQSR